MLSVVGILAALAVSGTPAAAQQRVVRFEITSVGDSTFAFRVGSASWVRAGAAGTAIDPRRRDELVARFRVLGVREGSATALVTGQTTAITTDHVATMEEPRRPWYRHRTFWSGLILGAALGLTGAAVSR